MHEPSKTSLNWANRAPGRAPVETRDDMLLRLCGELLIVSETARAIEVREGRVVGV